MCFYLYYFLFFKHSYSFRVTHHLQSFLCMVSITNLLSDLYIFISEKHYLQTGLVKLSLLCFTDVKSIVCLLSICFLLIFSFLLFHSLKCFCSCQHATSFLSQQDFITVTFISKSCCAISRAPFLFFY